MAAALPRIAIVLPAHNEAANVGPMAARIGELMAPVADWQIVFVDDGSRDTTLAEIRKLAQANPRVRYVALARNFGHQAALRAGLQHAEGDAVAVMDCDFEHPPDLLPKLVAEWQRGFKIVLTQREVPPARTSLARQWSSRLFYVLFDFLSDVRMDPSSPDFMLLDRAAVNVILRFESQDLFLRGLVRWIGFTSSRVGFTPGSRHAGRTKYTLSRMVDFALMGIAAHSIKPLRMAIYLSFLFALLGSVMFIYSLVSFFWISRTVAGWTSIMSAIAIMGAGQFLVLGIMGDYVGRVLREARRWPVYIVAETEAAVVPAPALMPAPAERARPMPHR